MLVTSFIAVIHDQNHTKPNVELLLMPSCCSLRRLLVDLIAYLNYFFFFFQAEDGIRDDLVTGVQTCALPIYRQHHTRNHAFVLLVPLAPILAGFSYGAGGFNAARNISTAGPGKGTFRETPDCLSHDTDRDRKSVG